jgi:hypothetical protein
MSTAILLCLTYGFLISKLAGAHFRGIRVPFSGIVATNSRMKP